MQTQHRPDIIDILAQYGHRPRLQRDGWAPIACPFHDDRNASASVNRSFGKLKCHGCGWHGDVFDIISEKEGITLKEAFALANTKTTTAQPRQTVLAPTPTPAPELVKAPTIDELVSLEMATQAYQRNLIQAMPYLSDRGISQETAERFRLGYHPQTHRITIPYINNDYEVEDIRFRCIASHDCRKRGHGKYMSRSGVGTRPYNTLALEKGKRTGAIIITEGEMDTITLHEIGIQAVGIPGAQAWKKEYAKLFAEIPRIYIFGDGDKAGQQFIESVRDTLPNAIGIKLADGKDVNDIYLEEGQQSIYNSLSTAKLLRF
jgi:DNA primase